MKKITLFTFLAVISMSTFANPGRYQINQACIDVGCFVGDDPNTVTIEITQASGTFVLTSDLVFDSSLNSVPAILVSRVDNDSAVTIDLNGYQMRLNGAANSNTNGIDVIGEDSFVTIKNGKIVNFSDGVHAVDGVTLTIKDMVFQGNADDAVQMPLGSIRNSVFDGNNYSIFAVNNEDAFNGDRLIIESNQFFGVDQQVFSIGSSNLCKDNMVAYIGTNSNLGSCTLSGLNLCGSTPCAANAINSNGQKE